MAWEVIVIHDNSPDGTVTRGGLGTASAASASTASTDQKRNILGYELVPLPYGERPTGTAP
jgi:hypothetical protein